jgi:hypothetical protein
MVVSDIDDGWIDNTMDAIEETTAPDLPDPPRSNYTLYIPDFVTKQVHDGMTAEEMLAAHVLFLRKDWLTPGLTVEIHRQFPPNEEFVPKQGKGAWSHSKITASSCFL